MTLTQITEKGIKDGEIVNADINASAAIAKSKLASLDIVNADINASAAIAKSKLASLDIVNADINASAAIAGTKISPDFGSQNVVTTGTVGTGVLTVADASGSDPTMQINHSAADVTGEFIRVGRTDLPAIRYHSIKAKHSGGAAGNILSFNIHDCSSTTAQTEVLTLLGNGNVGIGTNNPTVTLDIESTTPTIRLTDSDASGTPESEIKGGGGDLVFSADRDNEKASTLMQFQTDGSTAMTIDSSQNVGIGTTSPSTKFEVRDGSATGISSRATSTQATDGNKALKVRNNSDTDTFNVSYKGQGYFAGKLGIGTTSPVAKLNVDSGGTDLAAQLVSNDTNVFLAFKDGDASGNQQVQIGGEENNLVAYAGGSERMRIDSTGRVGIGTTSMSSSLNVYHATNNEMAKFESGDEYVHIVFKDSTTSNTPYIGAQGDNFRVITGGAEHMQIDSSGNCKINSGNLVIGTAGKGIDFSAQTPSAASGASNGSEVLDHYEEGTWTPTAVNFSDTFTISASKYLKVGSLVHVQAYVSIGVNSNTHQIKIGGLPFTAGGGTSDYSLITTHTNGGSDNLALRSQGSVAHMTAVHTSGGDGDSKPTYSGLSNKFLIFGGTYYAS